MCLCFTFWFLLILNSSMKMAMNKQSAAPRPAGVLHSLCLKKKKNSTCQVQQRDPGHGSGDRYLGRCEHKIAFIALPVFHPGWEVVTGSVMTGRVMLNPNIWTGEPCGCIPVKCSASAEGYPNPMFHPFRNVPQLDFCRHPECQIGVETSTNSSDYP